MSVNKHFDLFISYNKLFFYLFFCFKNKIIKTYYLRSINNFQIVDFSIDRS